MPDWLSHLFIGLIICSLFNLKPKSLVLLGSLLPDFLFKITTIGFFIKIPTSFIYWFFAPMHTPIGSFLMALAITPLFRFKYKKTLLFISIGLVTHFAADSLVKFFLKCSQLILLFPFSWKSFSLPLIWADQYYMILFASIFIYGLIILIKLLRK